MTAFLDLLWNDDKFLWNILNIFQYNQNDQLSRLIFTDLVGTVGNYMYSMVNR